jgi:Fur family ferric uptake transcriptional regulator
MEPAEQVFRGYLSSKGLRLTGERKEILDEIMRTHTHFEVEDIFSSLRKKDSSVSRASIYRMLPLLLDSGIIRKTPCEVMKARYEHVLGHEHHDHMVCIKCGKTIEFKKERIEKLQQEAAREHHFRMLGHRLIISGLCKDCK